ncbi:hypothetical protein HPB50_012328 [Hyalomma asiaticum]|uniref:Uncharacterized protein n=1 Tax=Hyalomma asiaticum TaxID=266040 RepID=A0ACB7TFC4_HYAAI|nr:hypothetical protein HPB50_012328 [Hyalomma asiaticum]
MAPTSSVAIALMSRSAEPGEVQGDRGSEVPGASVRATGWIKGRRAVSSRTQRCSRLGRGPLVPDYRELCLVVSRVKRGKPSAELPHRSRVEQHFGTAQTVLCWTGLPRATDTRGCSTRRPRQKLSPCCSRHLLDAATAPTNETNQALSRLRTLALQEAWVLLALGLQSTDEAMDTAALFAELAVADWILSDAAAMDEIAPPPPKFWLTRSCTFRSLWHWSFPVIWPSSPSPPGAPTINANAMCFCFVDLVALTTTEVLTKPFLLTSALIVMGVLIVLILIFGESTHHSSFRRAD